MTKELTKLSKEYEAASAVIAKLTSTATPAPTPTPTPTPQIVKLKKLAKDKKLHIEVLKNQIASLQELKINPVKLILKDTTKPCVFLKKLIIVLYI